MPTTFPSAPTAQCPELKLSEPSLNHSPKGVIYDVYEYLHWIVGTLRANDTLFVREAKQSWERIVYP